MQALSPTERLDVERVIPRVRVLVHAVYGAADWPAYSKDDVFQAAMEAVCRARKRWDPSRGTRFSTFALGRAKGAILDFLRQQRPGSRHNPVENPLSLDAALSEDTTDTLLNHLNYEDPEPADWVLEERLWREVDRLSPRVAAAFRLHAEAGLSLREIGDVMGVTESRACQYVKVARARLVLRCEHLLAA